MLAPWFLATTILLGGWVFGWISGSYDPLGPLIVHIGYFFLGVPWTQPKREWTPYLVMGPISLLAFWEPLVGITLGATALLVVGLNRFSDWWVTPIPRTSLCKDTNLVRRLPEYISPYEYFRLRRLWKRQSEART